MPASCFIENGMELFPPAGKKQKIRSPVFARFADFVCLFPQDKLDELAIPQNWQKYVKLNYIFDMKELF